MTPTIHALADADDAARVGGKAASLGRLFRAGFPVPDGFVIDTAACVCAAADDIRAAYAAMGGGTVAVRSSATAEDAAAASMAGQYDTVLNVNGDEELLAAVRQCRDSLRTPRAAAYLAGHGIDAGTVGMAIVVQRQVAADAAGVLFTASPDDAFPREMLINVAPGLGEAVVSGRVQPDVLRIAFDDGRVIAATHQAGPCLDSADVRRLWELGRRAESHFGCPQDFEWAVADSQLYLLQSRPITTHADAAEVELAGIAAREQAAVALATGRGPWVLHNLAETLAHPTPLTWSVVGRFMSAAGGYGDAYRRVGFAPAGEFLDLIGGRIYMDASRAPRMFSPDFPMAYDAEALRARPDVAQRPPTLPTGSLIARVRASRLIGRAGGRLQSIAADTAAIPAAIADLVVYVDAAEREPLDTPDVADLFERLRAHEARVMDEFGPHEVLAGLNAGMAMDGLRAFVAEHIWDDDADAVARLLSSGGPPESLATSDAELYEVGKNFRPLDAWLAAHGHRGPNELDLAAPRWRERPDDARLAAKRMAAAGSPADRAARHRNEVERRRESIRVALPCAARAEFDRRVDATRQAIRTREDAKDALVRGVGLLRHVTVEIGRRLGIGDGVFYLSREELIEAVRVGYAPVERIERARRRHTAQRRLRLPSFIGSADDFTARPDAGGGAIAISGGVATGPARIVTSPEHDTIEAGDVLVCSSTDPAWTPLLGRAAALVVECGGVLSHGAIVAREMGVPAVVLADATRRFKDGDLLRVDGTAGCVEVGRNSGFSETRLENPCREIAVPPPGAKDRRAAVMRNVAAIGWALFLIAFFFGPEQWIRRPTFVAVDSILWPAVRSIGWPVTVGALAAVTATTTLLLQRALTDNRRLLEAKRRAAALRQPAGVTARVLGASLVPVGLLLGPMVVLFVWLGERATPAAWNAPAGSAVRVVATIDGEWTRPVRIGVPAGVTVDESTPVEQAPPPVRATLERLLSLYRMPKPIAAGEPWELTVAPDSSRRSTAADLQAFLSAGMPPQTLAWLVRPAADFDGRFGVSITTPDAPPLAAAVTVGPSRPPSPLSEIGPLGSPLGSVRVVYPPSNVSRSFLKVAGVDVGWLGVYVGVYVVTLTLVRRVAKVA